MVAPPPPTGAGILPYAIVAGFMVVGTVYILYRLFPRDGTSPTLATLILMVGLLAMTTGLWFAEIFAIVDPGDASVVSVFIALNSMMGVVGAWAIGLFYGADERRLPRKGWGWPVSLAGLVVGNELLMGVAFVLALGRPGAYGAAGGAGLVALVADGTDSIWFFGAMFVTMEFLVLWLPLPGDVRRALVAFTASAAVGPWIVLRPLAGALAMAVVMACVFGLVLRELLSNTTPSPELGWVGLGITASFALMGAGVVEFLRSPGSLWGPVPFALVSLSIMLGELLFLARWWLSRPDAERSGAIGAARRLGDDTPPSPTP